MATLQSIRNHGTILLVVVGVAMLAFILGDFLNSGSSFFNKGRENVAEIAGHKVHYTEYEAANEQLVEVYKIATGSTDINEELTIGLRKQVWQDMVTNYTLTQQTDLIGMDITSEELSELCIGTNPHEIIRQRREFYDETGNFNRVALIGFLNSLEQEAETAEQAESLQQAKTYWLYWENTVRLQYLQEKYTSLLNNLLTANPLDAKYGYEARQSSVNVEYVLQPYYAVADSLVKVTNSEIKKLYNQKKEQYKQVPNRSIQYVSFPILPSEEDYKAVENIFKSIEADFKTKEDVAALVNSNSDVLYDGRDYSASTIPSYLKDFAFGKNAKKGDCTEIIFNDSTSTYYMARIMDCGYNKADSVKLVAISDVDSIDDVELDWFEAHELPKNIAEPAFAGKVGETFTASVGMGEQTYKIAEKSVATPKAKVAILTRTVTASSKTYGDLYNKAKQFIVAHNNADSLLHAAMMEGLHSEPAFALNINSEMVNDLKNSRSIVKWAFEAEEGQVSDVYECNNQFIVAALTEVNDGEYRSLESVKAELTIQLTNEKKAEYIANQWKSVTTLADAAKIAETEVKTVENLILNSSRVGNSNEPAVVGTAFALAPNTVSAPIAGNTGVYMISVGEKTVAEGEFNVAQEIQQMGMYYAYTKVNAAIQLIQDNAKIVDNRYRVQ